MKLPNGYYIYPGDTFRAGKRAGSIKEGDLAKIEGIEGDRILINKGAYALRSEEFLNTFGTDRLTDTVNRAVLCKTDNEEFPINCQIWTSVKGGPFSYCGNGKFCRNIKEAEEVARQYRAVEVEYA